MTMMDDWDKEDDYYDELHEESGRLLIQRDNRRCGYEPPKESWAFADLRGANLQGYDLREADLHGADLRGADLSAADLREADLREVDLRGADLSEADLRKADLKGSDLRWARMRWADLKGANLQGVDLRGADVDFASWPLCCGSESVIIDEEIARQLFAHAAILAKQFIEITSDQRIWANKFHRIVSGEFPQL